MAAPLRSMWFSCIRPHNFKIENKRDLQKIFIYRHFCSKLSNNCDRKSPLLSTSLHYLQKKQLAKCDSYSVALPIVHRPFSTSPLSCVPSEDKKSDTDQITVCFITKDKEKIYVKGSAGEDALNLAHKNDIEMEGACEGSLACTTCHVYVKEEYFDKLPPASEIEEDLLDKAPFLKPNSRLGCQVVLTKELDGIELTLPPATVNFYVDGHTPKPH